ncbi:c-type cytochrome [Mucilaginibacter hurinus]|uniref:c-type cytochrome n=1 Tax=Mucilaginibacter hurinus TaxID=2201324 RepID=UPI0018F36D5E|nr:c-type cytochrome [Mucilaginibacter hurinus]
MKKIFVILSFSLMIAACGGSSDNDINDDDTTTAADNTALVTPAVAPADTQGVTTQPRVVKKPVMPPASATPATPAVTSVPAPSADVAKAAQPAATAQTAAGSEKGGQLIKGSDCLACHKDNMKIVGPAYVDVAKKYKPTPANIDMLANKIIKGGAGNWGDIPMSPHPSISKSDAKEMVKYILALK